MIPPSSFGALMILKRTKLSYQVFVFLVDFPEFVFMFRMPRLKDCKIKATTLCYFHGEFNLLKNAFIWDVTLYSTADRVTAAPENYLWSA